MSGNLLPAGVRETLWRRAGMRKKKYKPAQILALLMQIEQDIAKGRTIPQACRRAQITLLTFYRWRKDFSGVKQDQAKRLKRLESENAKLKELVAKLLSRNWL